MSELPSLAARLLVQHARAVVVTAVVVTALLVIPMLTLHSDAIASTAPGGEVFDLRNIIDQKLPSRVFVTAYLAEAKNGGDMLTKGPLLELLHNEQALLSADANGDLTPGNLERRPYLIESYDTDTGVTFRGMLSMADAVDAYLHILMGTSLENATNDQIKVVVSFLMSNPKTQGLHDHLSALATHEKRMVLGREIDYWQSPALLMAVYANNTALGGASSFKGLASSEADLNTERFARKVQYYLRGSQTTFNLWGLAIDQTLTAQDEGKSAGTFIVLTVVAALVVVGAALRAYWPTALTAIGVGALMIWLKGLSALVGIKGGLIIDLIVPIAMVSLGVDFSVHAVRRYFEERTLGFAPRRALVLAFTGVLAALLLAMLSDGIAFLSNVPSGIEAVVQFGLAAGIAVLAAFIVLGVVVPLAVMRIDELRAVKRRAEPPLWAVLIAAAGVTGMTGAGTILLVAVDRGLGTLVLLATTLLFVVAPLVWLRFAPDRDDATDGEAPKPKPVEISWFAHFVAALAAKRAILLPTVLVLTVFLGILAFRLKATFDVKDFYSSNSDLVVGLDKLDKHVGSRTGEAGIVFIQGDLTQPSVLRAMRSFVQVQLTNDPYVGKEADGTPSVFEENLLHMIDVTMASQDALDAIAAKTGVTITDQDGDGFPDTPEQLRALYSYITTNGVPLNATTAVYAPDVVRETLYYNASDPTNQITTMQVGIPGTREQSVITGARDALQQDTQALRGVQGITRVGLTGSPFIRDAELTATVNNLRRSIPIAAAGALLLLLVAFRSVRYAVVTIIPIGLVVVWLYAFMEVAGFALNFVSATIGAVSIGVGIDYSIHMTERFREEMGRHPTRFEALRRASSGTGIALLASAGSSVVGFAIMGFAPMPLFSTYGILTSLMIFLSLGAALMVLPSLLMLVTKDPEEQITRGVE